jgi:hypothetical protein
LKYLNFQTFSRLCGLIPGLILGLLVSSCSTGFNTGNSSGTAYSYNEIVIVNRSRHLIEEVTISAGASGRSFNCGNVAPLGICADKFPSRRYQKNPVRVDWVVDGTAGHTREFVLEVPATFSTAFPLRGVVDISPGGSVSAYFQQDEPMN